jgi:uncharacterized protein YecE (DUF72 family)
MARYIIGTSGWHYDGWRRVFYPEKLPKKDWLAFYAGRFPTVELNNSFYRLPTEAAFRAWHDATPPGFTFAVKASRFITHVKRLKDCTEPLANFMSRATLLKDKLGPVLYQLPSSFHRDDARLADFLAKLPGGRHVIEFRHASWLVDEVFDMLRRRGTGCCVFDMPELQSPLLATADFAYIRFHGTGSRYSGSYPDAVLGDWAGNIAPLARGLDAVYVYFNNDVSGAALRNAATLRDFLEKGKSV